MSPRAATLEGMRDAVLPETPEFVIRNYATLAERARTRSFGLIEQDVIVLDTETTGLSVQENKLIEISAARLSGREVVDRFDTFVHPGVPIPPEITELTGITDLDVAKAPRAEEAVSELEEFVGGCPVIAHNATFDRSFIESVKGGVKVSDLWIDSLALSRIALPRLRSHKLASMADLFGCAPVSHRSCDDVEALCGMWRILLTALSDLPAGLARRLADMYPDVAWAYRPIFAYLAEGEPDAHFSLSDARAEVLRATETGERKDADELDHLVVPTREQVEDDFSPGGLVSRMYEEYEPRSEQVAMALEVRDALKTSTHRVIEAGTGVGKSMAYLVPVARTAKMNNITMGIATKSNNLADQLMYQELPKLARELPGGLSFCALKGYDHYPCLRKLEMMSRGREIHTARDPADTLTAIAVIYAFVCQSPSGDLDGLGIRWRSVSRESFTTSSRDCARRLCPFYPDGCLVHGARRRAARADIVVTNHSLLFRNVSAEGRILPPIRHWVVDEAHSMEKEARRQWALTVSAEESRSLFEYLGDAKTGVLGRLIRNLAGSDAATLYMGLGAKAASSVERASMEMAVLFDGIRELDKARTGQSRGYETSNVWIGAELRGSEAWREFVRTGQAAADALDEACRNVSALVEAVSEEHPELVIELSDCGRRMQAMLDALKLIVAGEDDRYVYSYQVNHHIRAGGESLTAELFDVGEALATEWLPEVHTAIFTSGTMAVADDFSHFDHAVGLDRLEAGSSKDVLLDSSYDLEHNMAVVVTGDIPDPRRRESYLDALEELLVDVHVAMGGATLTLFTNRRDMEELFHRVEPRLSKEGLELNCQLKGSSAKRLRDRFIQEPSSSLFALKAFWEGFDATGDALRCVVIPKLPFSSPTDPLACERDARERGAWGRYSLPEAVLEVKQAAGRLIRSSKDTGVLVLADSRLVSKGYGKKFLNSLPAQYQQIDSSQVGRYITIWRKTHDPR